MAFEWKAFLDRHRIDYRTTKADLYIHCPFCGAADTGQKMGVSTRGRGWGCWRVQDHRGRDPTKLVVALLKCTWQEAVRITGREGQARLGQGGMQDMLDVLTGKRPPGDRPSPPAWPPEVHELRDSGAGMHHYDYMIHTRGYKPAEVRWLAQHFGLRYASTGHWRYRVLIPVYADTGELASWTGRHIGDHTLRYESLTSDPDKAKGGPVALGPINNYLLGLPALFAGGDTLVVAEGPFDAMSLALEARWWDMQATCVFGKAITDAQVDLLLQLAPLYRQIWLLLDPDAALDQLTLQRRVAPAGVKLHWLEGDEDPGEMKPSQIRALLARLTGSANTHNAMAPPPMKGRQHKQGG